MKTKCLVVLFTLAAMLATCALFIKVEASGGKANRQDSEKCASPAAVPRTEPDPAMPAPVVLSGPWFLQDAARVKAQAFELSQGGFQEYGWYRASVPGTVLSSLVNNKVYPEPLYGENNRPDKIPESLCRTSYWYRTEFSLPPSFRERQVQLNFAGINYLADVFLNGKNLGKIKGAFARGRFDITSLVHKNGINTLAVKIMPPPDPGLPLEQTIKDGVGPNGGALAAAGPTFLCTMGWDWIPGIRDRDMGIWQPVSISAHGPVTIRDTSVSSELPLPGLDSADLTLRTTLSNDTPAPVAGELVGSFGEARFRYPLKLAAGEKQDLVLAPPAVPQLHVRDPKLWWPNGYGPQNLYNLNLKFVCDGSVSDFQSTNFGIRKISYALPGSENLALSVNGVPVMSKGGNWGMDEAMKRVPLERLEAQIRMHRDANFTIIRNWVGQSTSEDFYNLCDRYGIMVWDEMFQPNPCDGPNPTDVDLYLSNCREKILRFRGHPCIALWCGRNEGYPPPQIDNAIRKIAATLDPARLYQPSSTDGRGVHSGGPYYWRTPREYYVFNEPYKTEIGSVSIPTLESVQAMMPEKDWNTINDDWAEHDLASGAQGGDWYPGVLAGRYGAIGNLADFVRKGQMANYEAYRAMYEGRNARLFNPSTGVITWMSNPAQPSFVWQLYAWDLEPNAALFATRKACEPVHIQLNQENWHLMVINNTPTLLANLTAAASVYNLDGALKAKQMQVLAAPGSAASDCGELNFPGDLSPVHLVKLTLHDQEGRLVSENFYWRETHQDNFQALNSLDKAKLTVAVSRRDAGEHVLMTVQLSNPSRIPAIMAHLQLRKSNSAQRVLPVFYSDNYVSLLPGETRTLTVETSRAALGNSTPHFVLDGWNIDVAESSDVSANTNADPVPGLAQVSSGEVRINCGDRRAAEPFTFGKSPALPKEFEGDACACGGFSEEQAVRIKTSSTLHAAPENVYQSERRGEASYTIPVGRDKTYTLRLHFAEKKFDAAGMRLFNVEINGERKLSNFDIFAAAGGKNIALVKEFLGVAPDACGNVVVRLAAGAGDEPAISGIEVICNERALPQP